MQFNLPRSLRRERLPLSSQKISRLARASIWRACSAEIPIPISRVIPQIIRDCLVCLAAIFVGKTQIGFAIVSHELELELDLGPGVQATAEIYNERFGTGDASIVATPDRTEKCTWCPIDVDTNYMKLKFSPSILPVSDDQAPTKNELRDGDFQSVHDADYQIVRFREDPEVSETIQRRLLKIANRQRWGAFSAWNFGDLVGRGHGQRGSQDEENIGLLRVVKRALQVCFRQRLAKIDDAIEQDSTTDRALATCAVVMRWTLVGGNGPEIWGRKVQSACKTARISRQLNIPRMYSFPQSLQYSRLLFPWTSDIRPYEDSAGVAHVAIPRGRVKNHRQDPTPSMQTVTILTDEVLENPAILQLHECHVSWRGYGLQSVDGSQVVLTSLCHQRPGAFRTSEVSNAGRRRDSSTREDDQVFAPADLIR